MSRTVNPVSSAQAPESICFTSGFIRDLIIPFFSIIDMLIFLSHVYHQTEVREATAKPARSPLHSPHWGCGVVGWMATPDHSLFSACCSQTHSSHFQAFIKRLGLPLNVIIMVLVLPSAPQLFWTSFIFSNSSTPCVCLSHLWVSWTEIALILPSVLLPFLCRSHCHNTSEKHSLLLPQKEITWGV